MQHLSLFVWLISPRIVYSKSTDIVSNAGFTFWRWRVFHHMCLLHFFFHSSIRGCLGCYHVLAIGNNAEWAGECRYLRSWFQFLWVYRYPLLFEGLFHALLVFWKDLHLYQFLQTEKSEEDFHFHAKRWKVKIAFSDCFTASCYRDSTHLKQGECHHQVPSPNYS